MALNVGCADVLGFQSLFYWNGLLRKNLASLYVLAKVFQSLFYWNGLLRGMIDLALAADIMVSILVLLEWSSEE